jgi:hypothetical protein
MKRISLLFIAAILIVGCTSVETEVDHRVEATVSALSVQWTQSAESTFIPTVTPTLIPDPINAETPVATIVAVAVTPKPTLGPDDWKKLPVLPVELSERMRQIYKLGQLAGNDPHAFSKVGDCNSTLPSYLGDIDNGKYNLGHYAYLQPTIDYFAGSFGRQSRAAKNGLTANAALVALWNDWKDCTTSETPLDCEYRQHKPAFALISFGTNDVMGVAPFETTLRRVIDTTIGHNVVPILVTKADNAEGDFSANRTIAKLAYEYDIPLWNFWASVQSLPDGGMRSPEHLSAGDYLSVSNFTADGMQYGQNIRNLGALEVLDIMRRLINDVPLSATPTP